LTSLTGSATPRWVLASCSVVLLLSREQQCAGVLLLYLAGATGGLAARDTASKHALGWCISRASSSSRWL
jgi:hypothetical protein